MSASLATLGGRIRAARQDAGLSQSQLGAPHFTRAYVSALELGKIRPSMKSLEFLAGRLGKAASFFVEDEAEAKRRQEREFTMLHAKELIAKGETRQAVALLEPLLSQDLSAIDLAHVRRLLGLAFHWSREPRFAIEHLSTSIGLLAKLGRERELQRARRDLAAALLEAGLADRALAIYRELLETVERDQSRDPIFRMVILRGLGATYSMLGDGSAAIAYYEQALKFAQDVGDLSSLGRIYSGLAYGYWLSGDHEGAIGNMQRAISTHQNAQDYGAVAELHNNLAVLCLERQHLERAREHVALGRRIAVVVGRPALSITLDNTEAEIEIAEGRLELAEAICQRAISEALKAGFARGRAAALRLLGRVAARRNRRRDAVRFLDDAAKSFAEIHMRTMAAECLHELGGLFGEWGDPTKAAKYASQAYELARNKTVPTGEVS